SKLWNDAHKAEDVTPAVKESLRKLQLDYLDLYLIHWPVAFQPGSMMPSSSEEYLPLSEAPLHTTWKAMEQVKDAGYARHIGVSNFSKKKLQDLIPKSRYVPEVNQVEMHPLLQQNELVDYCKDHGIRVTAYSPLGSGDRPPTMKGENEPTLMEIPEIKAIAGKHGVSPAQVLINWHTQRDVAVIPKSTSQHNIEANYKASNVPLDADDMQVISSLDRNFRFITGTFFDAPDKGYSNVYDE
ncbi:MAG: aldo/keto reductase, partial [Bacteroidota bacterium]